MTERDQCVDHPDFRLIEEITQAADMQADLYPAIPASVEEAKADLHREMDGLVDVDSLVHSARHRSVDVLRSMSPLSFLTDPRRFVESVYIDAFLTGARFERRGGHREAS